MAPIVVTERLSRRFGARVAVEDITLSIEPGEIFGLLGPNGAGKSTTVRMLCGILDPSGGRGEVVGCDILRDAERIKTRIGYMTQRFSLYDDLTVQENLKFFGGIYGVSRPRLAARETIERAGLEGYRKALVGTLSGGWKQRVALACAMIHRPPLVFLDEPTAGVDPVSRRLFWDQIDEIAAAGTTVIVTTHYMDEAERCQRIAFISAGRVFEMGKPTEVVSRLKLSVVELEVSEVAQAVALLRARPEVLEVAHFGTLLRVTMRGSETDAQALIAWLAQSGVAIRDARALRAGVEDAFVSMVRGSGEACAA